MVDRVIRVVLDSRDAEGNSNRLRNALGKLGGEGERSAKRIKNSFGGVSRSAGGLRRALTGVFALTGVSLGVKGLTQLADSYTQIQNRLRVVTSGQRELEAATQQVFEISQRTRGSFQATAELYSRVSLASRDLGINQQQVAQFTESLNQAVILSGASAQEASAGLIQLSQGLASGTLRGDELRSVLEQLPVVADVIAESLEVTRGELRLLGAEGLISAEEVIGAFEKAKDKLEKDFGKTVPTLGQSFELLRGQIIESFGEFNKISGATTGAASAIIFIRDGVADLTPGLLQLTRAIQGSLEPTEKLSQDLGGLAKVTILGVAGVKALADSFITTLKVNITTLKGAFRAVATVLGGVSTAIAQVLTGNFKGAKNTIGQLLDDTLTDATKTARKLNERITQNFIEAFERIDQIDRPEIRAPQIAPPEVEDNGENIRQQVIAQRRLKAATEARNEVFANTVALLKEENEVLGTSGIDRELLLAQLGLEEEIREALGDKIKKLTDEQISSLTSLTKSEQEQIKTILESNAALERREALLQELIGPSEELAQREADLNALIARGGVGAAQASLALKDLALARAELNEATGQLTDADKEVLANEQRKKILEELTGATERFIEKQERLNELRRAEQEKEGTGLTQDQFGSESLQNRLGLASDNFESGEASFEDGFILSLQNMLEAAQNFQGEAGAIFGQVFTQVSEGFADAAANAIIFGDSFKDAFGNVARQALQQLLSGLISLGVQFVINAALAKTGIASTAAAQTSANASITASATPAAAATSLASFGANAAPAIAGILAVAAIAASLGEFQTGGDFRVGGSGGRDSQLVAFRASPDETISVRTPQQRDREDNRLGSGGGGSGPAEPVVNNIINVVDPAMIEDALSTASGEQALVNVIQRNASSIRSVL